MTQSCGERDSGAASNVTGNAGAGKSLVASALGSSYLRRGVTPLLTRGTVAIQSFVEVSVQVIASGADQKA